MDKTVVVDGSTLNIKTKNCFVEENGKVRLEPCYIISKNGKEIMRCPVSQKNILIEILSGNADLDYYNELKNSKKICE